MIKISAVSNLYQLHAYLILTILGTKHFLQKGHVPCAPASFGGKLFLNHFLAVLTEYWGLTSSEMWELLSHASCWKEMSIPNTTLAVVSEQFLVSWHWWSTTCSHCTATSGWWALPHSAEAQQEPPPGRHEFLGLRVTQHCPCMEKPPQTSSKVHQRCWCGAAGMCCWDASYFL